MPQEEANFHRLPLACCQISELNCSKAPLDRWLSTTILSNICLIAAPILAPNLPISGNTAKYSAADSSIKNPVFMRVCGHFEARRTTRYDTNVITPKRQATGSNPAGGAKNDRCKPFFDGLQRFLLSFPQSILAALSERFYTFSAVCLLIGFELFFRPC